MSEYASLPFRPDDIMTRFQAVDELYRRMPVCPERVPQTVEVIRALELDKLVGRHLMVSSPLSFARRPDMEEGNHLMFARDFMFIGRLVDYSNLVKEDVPIDSMTADFEELELINIDPEDAPVFRPLRFEVPLLAMDSCVYAELD